MKCKKCDGKLIKTSDFNYEEILKFKNNELDNCALVLIDKQNKFLGLKSHKKSLNFRRIKEIKGNEIKFYGIKTPFVNGISELVRGNETITYSILEITEEIRDIIIEFIDSQDEESYSNTKMNNYLWKSSELQKLCEVEEEDDEYDLEKDEEISFDDTDDLPF